MIDTNRLAQAGESFRNIMLAFNEKITGIYHLVKNNGSMINNNADAITDLYTQIDDLRCDMRALQRTIETQEDYAREQNENS